MSASQNDEQEEFQNQGQSNPGPLCMESIDINNCLASYDSSEPTFELQLQTIYKPKLSCEKQSINLKDIELHSYSVIKSQDSVTVP